METVDEQVRVALAGVPQGRWIVGVSGGADSVALLLALRRFRPEVELVVAHLNHELRGAESDADADFVSRLAGRLKVPCVVKRIGAFQLEAEPNLEARFRAGRLRLFAETAAQTGAAGVLLAHHADDRAETVLLRLLRGGELAAIDSLRSDAVIDGLRIHRPFVQIGRATLEQFLAAHGDSWRVDASNASDAFARNRIRHLLATRPHWRGPILRLADAACAWRDWLPSTFEGEQGSLAVETFADVPAPIARHLLRRWLWSQGIRVADVPPKQIEDILASARDASRPASVNLPAGRTLRRKRGRLIVE